MNENAQSRRSLQQNWPYSADIPQRYRQNYERYLSRGGSVRPDEDVAGFVAGENGNKADMARFYFFCLAFDQLVKEQIQGDFAELGVYKGNTASLLTQFAKRVGSTTYLLDTFEGFNEADLKGIDSHQQIQFMDTSVEAVRALVGEHSVCFVKGYFPESASQIPDNTRFSLVHIDCDLYAPMASALAYFYPRLMPGGFMLLHDYSSLHWPGAERAVDEFFATKVECPVPLPDSAGSVTIRKAKTADDYDNWLVRERSSLLSGVGTRAAEGKLSDLLDAGWSSAEKWGVWGIGSAHELNIYLAAETSGDVHFVADVQAPLVGSRIDLEVDAIVSGQVLATWRFTRELNRGVRSVVIPRPIAVIASKEQHLPGIKVTFRPSVVSSPAALDPNEEDKRELGLGLLSARVYVV